MPVEQSNISIGQVIARCVFALVTATYINLNYDGLQDDVLRLITGEHLEISVDSFENDIESFKSKDDVITLMIHLGYLTYNAKVKTVRIPNEEIRKGLFNYGKS